MNIVTMIFNWLTSFFNEPDGKGSMKRLIMFFVTIAYLYSFIKVSIDSQAITDIPLNWAFLLSGFIGLGIVDKFVTLKNGPSVTDTNGTLGK